MPLDGLSSSNTGMSRFITPTEMAMQTEHIAQAQSEQVIKQPEKSEDLKNSTENNPEDDNGDLQGRDSSSDKNEDKSDDEDDPKILINNQNSSIKKYRVKFNSNTEMVEFIDKKTGNVIENMSPRDLLGLVSKSIKPSGFLVDKEV